MCCSFHRTCFLPSWLMLSISFFQCFHKWNGFLNFPFRYSLCVEMQLIFAGWLCILLLCWIHLLVLKNFFVEFLGFLHITDDPIICKKIFLLPFQCGCLLFLFLAQLVWLGLPVLCWIEVVKTAILDLKEKAFCLSPLHLTFVVHSEPLFL